MADSILTKSFNDGGALTDYLGETFGWAAQLPKLHFEKTIADGIRDHTIYNLRDYDVGYNQKYPLNTAALGLWVRFENFVFNYSSDFRGPLDCVLRTSAGYDLFSINWDGTDWYVPNHGNGSWFVFTRYGHIGTFYPEIIQISMAYLGTPMTVTLSFDYEMIVFPITVSGSERNLFQYDIPSA